MSRTWFGKGEDYAVIKAGGLMFREVAPGDMIAPEPGEEGAAVEWLCPALATGHATRLAARGALQASDVRAFILENYEATKRPS